MFKLERLIDTTRNFFKRDIKIKYAGSILGPIWIVIHPLVLTLVTTLVFSLILRDRVRGIPYVLFVMIGFISWGFFSQSVSQSTGSLVRNQALVVNAKFSKMAIVISILASKLVDYLVNLVVFLSLFLLLNQQFRIKDWLLVLLIVLIQLIFQLGLSLVLAAFNVFYRDVQNLVDIGLQILFYATPIVYPLSILPEKAIRWFKFNPLSQIIELYRQVLFEQQVALVSLGKMLIISFLMLGIGIGVFKKLENKFADVI